MEEMGWWTLGTGILENKDLSSAPFVSCLSLKAQEGSIGEANVLHAEGARINPWHLRVSLGMPPPLNPGELLQVMVDKT